MSADNENRAGDVGPGDASAPISLVHRDSGRMLVTKDFVAGLLFIIVGGGAAFLASGYRLGTAARMGPGYLPFALGILLVAFGVILAGRAYLNPASTGPVPVMKIRPLILVLIGVVAFGAFIRSLGLVVAIVALILISRFATREGSWPETILMLIVLTIVPIGIFVYGLGMSFQLWPR